jgi:hypothetical protein
MEWTASASFMNMPRREVVMLESKEIESFFVRWKRRCATKWIAAAGAITFIATYSVAYPFIASLRPWATRYEAKILANNVYPRAIREQLLVIATIEDKIKWLEARGNVLDPVQLGELYSYREQLILAKEKLTLLSREQSKFQLEQEVR